jgi:hypothetical protein
VAFPEHSGEMVGCLKVMIWCNLTSAWCEDPRLHLNEHSFFEKPLVADKKRCLSKVPSWLRFCCEVLPVTFLIARHFS